MSQNGMIVLRAIEELAEPVTARNIVDHIAQKADVPADRELKETVKETLDGGVRFGFVQRKRGRYYTAPKHAEHEEEEALSENRSDASRP